MIGPKCPLIHRDEDVLHKDEDIVYINTSHKKEFEFWCREKND